MILFIVFGNVFKNVVNMCFDLGFDVIFMSFLILVCFFKLIVVILILEFCSFVLGVIMLLVDFLLENSISVFGVFWWLEMVNRDVFICKRVFFV